MDKKLLYSIVGAVAAVMIVNKIAITRVRPEVELMKLSFILLYNCL